MPPEYDIQAIFKQNLVVNIVKNFFKAKEDAFGSQCIIYPVWSQVLDKFYDCVNCTSLVSEAELIFSRTISLFTKETILEFGDFSNAW